MERKRKFKSRANRLHLLIDSLSEKTEEKSVIALIQSARTFLQMPDSLVGLFQIIENLDEILPEIRIIEPELATSVCEIEQWSSLIVDLSQAAPLRNIELLTHGIKKQDYEGKTYFASPFYGLMEDKPVWCALWYCSGSINNQNRSKNYRIVQAYFLSAFMRLQLKQIELCNPVRLIEAGRLLREIHRSNYGAELDKFKISSRINELDLFYETLKELHQNGIGNLRQEYGAFADLLNDAFEIGHSSVFKTRKPGYRNVRKNRLIANLGRLYSDHALYWKFMEAGNVDQETNWPSVGIEEIQPSSDVTELLAIEGIDSGEYVHPDLAWVSVDSLVDTAEDPSELPPLGTLFGIARARARHLVFDVQRFTTRRSRIRINIFVRIMEVLDRLNHDMQEQFIVSNTKKGKEDAEKILETLQLVVVALVSGSLPKQLLKLPKFLSISELPSEYEIGYAPNHEVWVRPYDSPDRNPLSDLYTAQNSETWPRIILSDIWGVGRNLEVNKKAHWFDYKYATYEKVFNELIAKKMQEADVDKSWRTLDAMGNLLPGWFQGIEEGDHLRSAIIFGRDDRLARTQRYYTAIDRNQLNQYYCKEMKELWERLMACGFKPLSTLFCLSLSKKAILPSLVGDDRIPRVESVKVLIDALHQKLLGKQPAKNVLNEQIARHNDLVTYTALGMALVTGFRTVRTPVPDLCAIDQVTGLMCLQEKDRIDGSHARIVWLPEKMRNQIRYYIKHLKSLHRLMPNHWSTLLKVKATKSRDQSQYNDGSYDLNLEKTFFYIFQDNNGKYYPEELTGKNLQHNLNNIQPGHWPVPNAGRHFLRSYLVSKGCPETLINTHFGHWCFGEESWGPCSSFDPIRYRQNVSPYLEDLLKLLNYTEVEL